MTTICAGCRVFIILFVVLLHALCGSHISLPKLLIYIGSLSVNVLTLGGVRLSSSVFKLVFTLILICLNSIQTYKTQGAASRVTIISSLLPLIVQFISPCSFLIIVSLWVLLDFGTLYHSVLGQQLPVCGFRRLLKANLFDIGYPKPR